MNNQIFQWSRFVAALKKELVENKRMLLLTIVVIYGTSVIFMTLGNLITGGDLDDILLRLMPRKFAYMLFSFAGIVVASLAFRGLRSKTGRVELLTSPSSTLEKFLVNAAVYVLGFVIVCPLCLQLADLTRIAILWPWHIEGLEVPGPINFLTSIHQIAHQQNFESANNTLLLVLDGQETNVASSFASFNVWLEVMLWMGVLSSPGLYLLGSVLWPRLSFLKTMAATYVIEFVMMVVVGLVIVLFSDMRSVAVWVASHTATVMKGVTVFVAVQLVVYWALAWWLWKRKDVISLKWWS